MIYSLMLLAACVLWSISFVASKIAVATTPPMTVAFLRLAVASICFIVWLSYTKQRLLPKQFRWLLYIFGLSLLGTSLHYAPQTVGIQYTSASNASVYAVTAPLSIAFFGALILGERVTLTKMFGFFVCTLGALLVMGIDNLIAFRLSPQIIGDVLVILSIISWGLFTVLGKRATERIAPLQLTGQITILGALTMLPFAAYELSTSKLSLASLPSEAWLSMIFLGLGCTFAAVLLYVSALEKIESHIAAMYQYTIPPMTCVFAIFWLGESLTWNLVFGTALVMLGVLIIERNRRPKCVPVEELRSRTAA